MTDIHVGVIQLDCTLGDIYGNLLKAEKYVKQAANNGAQIIVLPELMSSGYTLTDDIWEYGEPPINGPTELFLMKMGLENNCFIGASFLQANIDGHFYNVFSLASNEGKIIGRVYKQFPASFESFFFTSPKLQKSPNIPEYPHIIDTPLGRLGIQICYENMLYDLALEMRKGKPDLILMSFSAPQLIPGHSFPIEDCNRFNNLIDSIGCVVAKIHHIPCIYCNKVGIWKSKLPLGFLTLMPFCESKFPGKCSIIDKTGKIIDQLDNKTEGSIVRTITIPNKQQIESNSTPIPSYYYNKFIIDPFFALKAFSLTEFLGRLSYDHNPKRFDIARRIAQTQIKDDNTIQYKRPKTLDALIFSSLVLLSSIMFPIYFTTIRKF